MKKFSLRVVSLFVFTLFIASCHQRCIPSPEDEVIDVPKEEITLIHTYRNNIPPPPIYPWTTLDTTNLDLCKSRLWDYLKTMYPTEEENYWDYDIYSITNEPDEIFANRAFISKHVRFFNDTIYSRNGLLFDTTFPCINVDSTFFLEALGPPTFKTYLGDQQVNYFYNFKLKYRHGPCPYIFDEGDDYEYRGNTDHINYCATMKVKFLQESGRMIYIHFFGPG